MLFYKIIFLISDIFLVNFSFFIALLLRFDAQIPQQYMQLFAKQWIILTLIHLVCNIGFRSYQCMLRYITSRELMYILTSTLCGSALFFFFGVESQAHFPRSTYITYTTLLLLFMILSRFSYKIIHRILRKISKGYVILQNQIRKVDRTRTLLIGAGDAAAIVIRENKKNPRSPYRIVAALDDNKSKHHSRLNGIHICGSIDQLERYIDKYQASSIIIALPSIDKKRLAEIIKQCAALDCSVKIFPGVRDSLTSEYSMGQIRNVNIEDLLGREEIVLDTTAIATNLINQPILITGGGGSIGSELCRQIASYKPSHLIVFDIYENNAYDIQNELLQNGFPREKLTVLIGSIRDYTKLSEIFNTYRPAIVFHAAAHKHVPLMEDSPAEAIKNNVFGTLNVAECAKAFKVKKFILISTDKAVNPTNVMGATKRLCELIIQSINSTTPDTDFVAVRFGNVLGSNGSVIPLFRRQLEAGGPLTVTHQDIIRYFMTIPEAVRLILQAMSFADGGEIFVLDMGDPVKIMDLALNFIKLSGLEPHKDIEIKITGLRPGEKLYEELLTDEEGIDDTGYKKIFIGKPSTISFGEIMDKINYLKQSIETGANIPESLSHVVPTYKITTHAPVDKEKEQVS